MIFYTQIETKQFWLQSERLNSVPKEPSWKKQSMLNIIELGDLIHIELIIYGQLCLYVDTSIVAHPMGEMPSLEMHNVWAYAWFNGLLWAFHVMLIAHSDKCIVSTTHCMWKWCRSDVFVSSNHYNYTDFTILNVMRLFVFVCISMQYE